MSYDQAQCSDANTRTAVVILWAGKGMEEAKTQVAWLDRDGDGQVDKEEYVTAMVDWCRLNR
jgi:hypothetical protein